MKCATSINIYPSDCTITVGNWYYGARVEVCPADADCTGVEWYSDNTSVATVNSANGYIFAHNPGTARIYARTTDGSGLRDYLTVTVTSGVICVSSVTLSRTTLTLEKGDTATLLATVCPLNATNKELSWRSTDSTVASVSEGVVTAKAKGKAYIYAETVDGSGMLANCYVSVTENILVKSVTINMSNYSMTVGSSAHLYETVCPENATNKCVKWTSSNTEVATVNPNNGVICAIKVGTTTITAVAQDGSNQKGYCTINVIPVVQIKSISVNPSLKTVKVGETTKFQMLVCPTDATNKLFRWTSSDSNVASVDYYTGEVKALKVGSATITATSVDGCFSDSALLYVNRTKIYQTQNTFRCKGDGTLAEDLQYNDIPTADLKAMDWINWSDFALYDESDLRQAWEDMCTGLFSSPPLKTVILDMIDHFMSGDATDYSNATLTEKVIEHESTQNYITAVKSCISQLLNQYNGDISALMYSASSRDDNPLVKLLRSTKTYQPVYNTTDDKKTGLTICIDGLWGNQIEVISYNKVGDNYSGVLSFTLYDHFGLDAADVEKYGWLLGFRAWYILQHNQTYSGAHKPFVSVMNFEVPFSGFLY